MSHSHNKGIAMNFGTIKELAVATWSEWNEDKAPRLAAALSYYTVFAIAPLLVIAIAIAGAVLGESSARSQVIGQIGAFLGPEGAQGIDAMLNAADRPTLGTFAGILGAILLLFGAAGFFGQLQDALNTIWEVAPKPNRGIWGTIKDRFFSFSMVLGTGFLLLVSLVLTTVLNGAGRVLVGDAFDQTMIWQVVNFLVSSLITWGLFVLIFKFVPDVKVTWKDVALGAALTAVLFILGRYLISAYLANAATASAYGAVGSLVILLLWVYYSAQILFLGAEFTQVYAQRYGSQIEPADNAVALSEEMRAKQGMPRHTHLAAAAEGRTAHAGETPPEVKQTNQANQGIAANSPTRSGLAGFALIMGLLTFVSSRWKRR
jgi:membrane protein